MISFISNNVDFKKMFDKTFTSLKKKYNIDIGEKDDGDGDDTDTEKMNDINGEDDTKGYNSNSNKEKEISYPLFSSFKLPIQYLGEDQLFNLSPIVSNDLELVVSSKINTSSPSLSNNSNNMYNYLFQPKHIFAKQMIIEWSKKYTTNVHFLKDTQQVIHDMELVPVQPTVIDCNKITEIWKSLKEDDFFLDKYGYMDWDMLLYLNNNSAFLQSLTVLNLMYPIYNLIIPIIILIIPFAVLKLQGQPINVNSYCDILKTIAKDSSIGRLMFNGVKPDVTKITYIIISFVLYIMQIYQNISSSFKFYKNISKINDHLLTIKEFVDYSSTNMENFVLNNKNKSTYREFCKTISNHNLVLNKISTELNTVNSNKIMTKINTLGYLLKCYYVLYSNKEYEESIKYCIGFEGYLNNLHGIYDNLKNNKINFAGFSNNDCIVKNQYYPPFLNSKHVKNSCDLKNNIIITGVNASGKTTILKTTLLNIIFSQQIGCGFYQSFILNPYTHIHSYLNIPDTSERDSLFQAETRRCKEIIDIINDENKDRRHFCIFDELYSGTNPLEATKCAYAFLLYLSKYDNVNFILTTHYVSICKKIKMKSYNCKTKIKNYKMMVVKKHDGSIQYLYKIKKGICKIEGAVNVLKQMNYPNEIINIIDNY